MTFNVGVCQWIESCCVSASAWHKRKILQPYSKLQLQAFFFFAFTSEYHVVLVFKSHIVQTGIIKDEEKRQTCRPLSSTRMLIIVVPFLGIDVMNVSLWGLFMFLPTFPIVKEDGSSFAGYGGYGSQQPRSKYLSLYCVMPGVLIYCVTTCYEHRLINNELSTHGSTKSKRSNILLQHSSCM